MLFYIFLSLDATPNPPKQNNPEKLESTPPLEKLFKTETPSSVPKKFDLKQEWQLLKTSFKEDITIFNEKLQPTSSISQNLYDDIYTPAGSSYLFRMENQISQIKSSFNDSCKSAEVIIYF